MYSLMAIFEGIKKSPTYRAKKMPELESQPFFKQKAIFTLWWQFLTEKKPHIAKKGPTSKVICTLWWQFLREEKPYMAKYAQIWISAIFQTKGKTYSLMAISDWEKAPYGKKGPTSMAICTLCTLCKKYPYRLTFLFDIAIGWH